MLSVLLIIAAVGFLFSNQLIQLSDNLPDFKEKILNVFANATYFINKNLEFMPEVEKGELLDRIKNRLNESSGMLLSKTFSSTSNIVFGMITSVVFTFLILIYREGLVKALVHFHPKENREKVFNMFKNIQKVGQQYLFGMMIIIIIIGLMNSIGLWIIGLDHPFLFGFLAAFLALIPYVGTFIGAILPILYALLSYDSLIIPILVALYFWFVQFVEGNFLTPKIVGGNLNINALASILSIIIGGAVWGIAGMILFLPFAAMLKVVTQEYKELKPIAMLIGEENYQSDDGGDKNKIRLLTKIKSWFTNKFRK
jgi:predicted PurR-regulated permease PerM